MKVCRGLIAFHQCGVIGLLFKVQGVVCKHCHCDRRARKNLLTMATSVCPYHDKRWRGETQHLINCLRGKLLPARQTKAFRRVVCSCEGEEILCLSTVTKRRRFWWLHDCFLLL